MSALVVPVAGYSTLSALVSATRGPVVAPGGHRDRDRAQQRDHGGACGQGDACRVVGRAVIDHDHLDSRHAGKLPRHLTDDSADRLLLVERRDQHHQPHAGSGAVVRIHTLNLPSGYFLPR